MQCSSRAAVLAAVMLLCGALAVVAQEPVQVPGYHCPKACAKDPNCHCASHDIPGGFNPNDIPQFVVLTNDDAITVTTAPVIVGITSTHNNPQGCEIPATWFVSMNYTDYHLVQEVYMKNHEIATHTLYHVADPDLFQIVGMKLWLNQTAHVPLEKLRGFRAPFLMHSPEQRTILQQNGFLYDSSIPEPFPTATSPSGNDRLWPYTMDYGLPQRCDLGTGPCSINESLPGLWEFPMWDVQDDSGVVLTNMDPQGDIYEAYKREFDRSYGGNRSPVGVYIHAAWLMDKTRNAEMNQFVNYALSHENTWFVTISEVIEWMKDPVDAITYANQRYAKGCDPPTDMWFPSGSFCQGITCVNGNFSDTLCECVCAAEFITAQPGWCIDPETKACTVPKVYDNTVRAFACPAGSVRDPPKAAAAAAPADVSTASCGHPLQDFVGLGISGTDDNAALYTQALRSVDGSCDTCASARAPSGNFFTLVLPARTSVSSVQLTTGESAKGAFIFVGDEASNNGMDNPVCAMNLNLPANTAVSVNCTGTGKYVTLAVPKDLVICDIYVTGAPATPLPSPSPEPVGNPGQSTTPTATATSDDLVSQLLNENNSDGSFQTTSEGGGEAGPDYSRLGMEGVNPGTDPTHDELVQQLTSTYEQEIAVINSVHKAPKKKQGGKKDRKLM
ncbi:hypothetical protein ACK3TF_005288 [Chlorella vulgaris]